MAHFHMGTVQSLTHSKNRVCDHLGIYKIILKWECFPIWIHHFHIAIPVWKQAGRIKKSRVGSPRSKIEFVTN
jgi:hypothetical protein